MMPLAAQQKTYAPQRVCTSHIWITDFNQL